ncbi:hypothetical protein D9757_000787 [Collybiopsis confluens]|uniref:Uncharacterized protein n=1 Tax=Collybiopsis confluens TaxID=2823264 RepID=A0A8H5MGU5_9AGAR|nr:hypothetical protein D9757_000787 [Collybiopsis confluens]
MYIRTVYIIAGSASGSVALILICFLIWLFVLRRPRSTPTTNMGGTPDRGGIHPMIFSKHKRAHSMSSSKQVRAALPPSAAVAVILPQSLPLASPPSIAVTRDPPESIQKSASESLNPAPQRRNKNIRSYERHKLRPPPSLEHPTSSSERKLQRAISQRSQRTYRSHLSDDSESMYSLASAPRDIHERLFTPLISTLDTIGASPVARTFPSRNYSDAPSSPSSSSDPSSPQNGTRKFLPPLPPIIRDHIYDPSSFSHVAPDVSVFPNSAFATDHGTPSLPPRSRLRQKAGK